MMERCASLKENLNDMLKELMRKYGDDEYKTQIISLDKVTY
jgi:hypothetical protein